jgi:aspartyl-tRNA(Asn)/glutamyl-tRNA(Gln) amidotransferase subunit C
MTKISQDDVLHLARLSNLQLNPSEVEPLQVDLNNILEYVQQLNEVDTDNVEPTYQVSGLENVWRKDEVIDYGIGREQLLNLSPDHTADSVRVPKVL